jgi:SAM-dependent methyltransferase
MISRIQNHQLNHLHRQNDFEKWRNRNLYYYQDLEKFYSFVVQPETRILEVGSGTGYLLNSLQPEEGLGIDIHPHVIDHSKGRFPTLEFQVGSAEDFQFEHCFDYVLLANTISYIENIPKALKNIANACQPSTRLILTFHNPAWEFILKFASLIGQRMPLLSLNWLSFKDIENLLDLSGFEVISHGKRMLFPKRIPLLSQVINQAIAPLPLINRFCLTEHIIVRKRLDSQFVSSNIRNMTCSIVIPARNEAGNIESCITRLPKIGRHTEIIFVEGNSTDHTWDEIKRVQNLYGHQWDIKAWKQPGRGKGDAVRCGFEQATGDVLIILDSDLTVRPEDLIYFFEAIASGHCELANGCRLIYPVSLAAMPRLNRFANRFFAWLLSYLLNTKIKDSLCGTKAISRENYFKISKNRSYFGDFDPFGDFDLLFGAAKLGLKIKDIPVRYFSRTYGKSNIHHVKEGLTLLKMCWVAAKKIKFI